MGCLPSVFISYSKWSRLSCHSLSLNIRLKFQLKDKSVVLQLFMTIYICFLKLRKKSFKRKTKVKITVLKKEKHCSVETQAKARRKKKLKGMLTQTEIVKRNKYFNLLCSIFRIFMNISSSVKITKTNVSQINLIFFY